MFRIRTIAFLLVTFPLFVGTAEALMTSHTLESPNKDFKLVIYIGPINDVSFGVFYKGKMIACASKLAFEVDDDDYLPATAGFRYRQSEDQPFPKPSKFAPTSTGPTQTRSVRNVEGQADYDEYSIKYSKRKEGVEPNYSRYNPEDHEELVNIVFRAYDNGIAYRYEIMARGEGVITIKNECAEFSFPDDYAVEGSVASLSKISKEHPSPLLITIPDVPTLTFGEVPHDGFATLRFKPGREWGDGKFNNLYDRHGEVDRTGKVTAVAINLEGDTTILGHGYQTPWRFMKFASPDSEGMLKSLNEPSETANKGNI